MKTPDIEALGLTVCWQQHMNAFRPHSNFQLSLPWLLNTLAMSCTVFRFYFW